jgi:hypothetical protein
MKKPTHGNELANEFFKIKSNPNNIKDSSTHGKDNNPTDTEILINICKYATYTKDSTGKCWADYSINNNRFVSPVRSKDFENWLRNLFYRVAEKPLTNNVLKPVIHHIEAHTSYRGRQEDVFVRFGVDKDNIHFLDLGDKLIRISKNGWKITENDRDVVPKFYRPQGSQKIPQPIEGGNIQCLLKYLNVGSTSDFYLLVSWLLAAMNPLIPTPILILQGEQGTAKSTTSKVLRQLIDPNGSPLRQCPKEIKDLYISALYSGIIVWDNLSGLSTWASDGLCRICSGSGFSSRELYTDTDEIIIQVQRPIILNGIDTIANRGDLLDRSIVINLPFIKPDKRVDEATFWKAFENDAPAILGALLNAYVSGLNHVDNIKLKHTPRMADYAKWVSSCEKSININEGTFLSAFNENQQDAVKLSLSSDPVATVLLDFLKGKQQWEGSATELIDALKSHAEKINVKSKMPNHKTLKDSLERLSPLLRKINIEWEYNRKDYANVYSFYIE